MVKAGSKAAAKVVVKAAAGDGPIGPIAARAMTTATAMSTPMAIAADPHRKITVIYLRVEMI